MRYQNTFLLIIMIAFFSQKVMADPYVGIGIGSASYKVDFTSLGGGSFDDSGTGTKLYGGYSFNKYFAAEASYYNFAEASIGSVETAPGSGVFNGGSTSAKGLGAYGVAMYPVSKKFNLMAKLGLLSWDADIAINNNSATNSGTDAAYGLAASYAFTKELLVIAEWESFNTDNPEMSMFSLGFRVNFR